MEAIWTSEVERTNDNIPDSPGGWADEAVLAYDYDRGALIYITSSRYHTFGRTWVLGEEGWREEHEAIDVSSDQFWAGHWDASRAGVACWSIYNDYVAGRRVPVGVLSSAAGVTLIETSGEVIIDDAPSSRESCAIFGQEHGGRARTWMITTTRIYALEDGVWSQVYHFDEDEIASDWRNATSGRAVWDAHRQRLVISLIDDEHDELVLYHFDGERFARLGMEGLPAPEEFYDHWKNGAFAIASAQTEAKGVYLILGDPHGTYRLGEADVWERVDTESEPMRSNRAPAAFDERDGSLWLGPGEYQLAPEVYAKQQEVFYKLDAQRWRVFGDVETPSPSDIYQGVVFAAHEGELHIITRQYEPLAYRIARDGGWEDVISKEDAPAALTALGLSGDAVVEAAAIDGSGVLHAFFRDGAVARWGGDGWSLVAGSDEATFKVRQGFCVAWHDVLECFVAWGGEVKNRASNHTFYLGEAGWKKEKKSSPRLAKERADGARLMRDTAYLAFDSHTRTLLRFRFAEVSVFENGVWVERTPTGYEQVASMIAPYPVADPVTGEVLLLDFFEHICWRFGFDGVERVATLVDHPRAANPDTGTHKDVPPFLLAGEYAYDRSRAMIIGQGSKNAAMQFTLTLREVFDSARSLGERAESSAGEHGVEEEVKDVSFGDEVRLYDPSKGHFWFGDVNGEEVLQREGRLWSWHEALAHGKAKEKRKLAKDETKAREALHKLAANRHKKGFVTATDIPDSTLTDAFARKIERIDIIGPLEDEEDPYLLECLGGRPRGLSKKDWPRDANGELLGHLVSVANFGAKKARVVSIFVPPNDFAMEDGACVAIPRTERQTAKGPSDPPGPVPMIVPQEISADEIEAYEVFPEVMAPLEEADPALASRIEAWHQALPLDDEVFSKVGGNPRWLQGEDWPCDESGERFAFFAQLDFSALPTEAIEEAWPGAKIWGTLYIFLAPDGSSAQAFWQYT